MKISVVTAAYNSQSTIGGAIESFLAQDHPHKELIVVDGGSRDRTLAIVRSFASPLIRIDSEPDEGPYDAMNRGLRLFAGDAVGILNSDDAFHGPDVLSAIAEALETADIVYSDVNMVLDHRSKTVVRAWQAGPYSPRAFQRGWMPPHPSFYVRRAVVERVGIYNLKYKIAADYDFMLRAMALNAFRIRYLPKVTVDFQVGGLSQSFRAMLRTQFESLRSRRDHLHAPPIDAAFVLRPLLRVAQLRGAYFGWLLKNLRAR